jgi:chromosomal replication initiation ATPase DnaA
MQSASGLRFPARRSGKRNAISAKQIAARPPIYGCIEAAVAPAFNVEISDLRLRTRGAPASALARQSAIYLAHVSLGIGLASVAAAFARHRSTAAHACRQIEDRRDDPSFDAMLVALETKCCSEGTVR